jgi:adenylate kinase
MKKFFTTTLNKQYMILMLGAPGVGKGTYSKILSKDINIPELSPGEYLRKAIQQKDNQTNLHYQKISEKVNKGELVDDNLMFEIVKDLLNSKEYKNGAILDGFPRNANQCVLMESYKKFDLVLNVQLNEEILIKKLLGRRVCKGCGKGYNICEIKENGYDMEPLLPKKNKDRCDDCNEELYVREDDKEDVIKKRLNIYQQKTKVLEEYYDKQGIMVTLELKRGIKDYPILRQVVSDKLKI